MSNSWWGDVFEAQQVRLAAQHRLALPTLMTYQQAADELGVSRDTVARWCRANRIQAVRLGHRTCRIRREDLLRFINTQRTPEPSPSDEPGSSPGERIPGLGLL